MYCNHCGKVIQDDAAVCAYCGIRVGTSQARKKLMRPRVGRKIAGVCLGFSEYFDLDVTLVRVVSADARLGYPSLLRRTCVPQADLQY